MCPLRRQLVGEGHNFEVKIEAALLVNSEELESVLVD